MSFIVLRFIDPFEYWLSLPLECKLLEGRSLHLKAAECRLVFIKSKHLFFNELRMNPEGDGDLKLEPSKNTELFVEMKYDTILMAESEEELQSLLMKLKEESEKVDLKLNIQKMKIMASGPITSWEIDAETVETVSAFIFLGCKITADVDCSHEIKRCLLLGRKVMST